MGSGMPEIGSRISLISKADIRYEGKLYSVDPEECKIALSSVKSFGTEDRNTLYPVPPQHVVYEFILFRGADIKDIRVLTTTIPNDPAIVQLSVPPSLSGVETQFESTDNDFRVSNTAESSNRIANAPGTSSRPSQTVQNSGFKSTTAFNNIDQVINKHPVQNAVSEDESRSPTPSIQNGKNSEAPARTSISSNKSDDESLQQQRKQQTFGNRDMNRYQQGNKPQYQQRYQQNRYPQQQQYQRHQQQFQYRDYNNRDTQYRNYNNDYRDGYGQRQYMQPLHGNVQRSNNWNNYNQRYINRPGQGVGNQNNYQSVGSYQNQNFRPRTTLKFDEEYDFEQANSQFEEMRLQLSKIRTDDADSPKVNSEVDISKKEYSGNEVSGTEENDYEAEQKDQCYDKVKSFFDQISYEAIERSKGLTVRPDWKTERKINSDTFGQVALRRNANNYRRLVNNNGGNGYYNNYQNNRNAGIQNNFRSGGYNNRFQNNRPRMQYNNTTGDHEESKENQVVA